ncbi:MAG TPA: DMT family protein [Caulobacteraceae bacterium]|nr:DMT family protein [Caulobacteraceae bacterium]
MSPTLWPRVAPFVMLLASNVFMTFAWYGHLKHKTAPLVLAVVVSWLIAGMEYMFAVPANRIGSAVYTTAELKTIQEAITLVVFAGFSVFYLHEPLKITTLIGFGFIFVGAVFVFMNR